MLTGITAAVLTGGKSKRFGRDKVVEPLGGVMLVERVLAVLRGIFQEVILIGHERKEIEGYESIPDIMPGCGPLGGIYTALASSTNPYCFIFAADMPNLSSGLINYMAGLREKADVIIPRMPKGLEPLHAVYSKRIEVSVRKKLKSKELRILPLIESVSVFEVDISLIARFGDPHTIFANINKASDMTSGGEQ
jgi:molybdopterin-guanine dinucleotide biosynthesis protein A